MSEPFWMVLARTEDGDSIFADQPLTAEEQRAMVKTYNRDFRRAPVICGWDPKTGSVGSAHREAELFQPLGYVNEISFDGLNLWGLIEEIVEDGVGRVAEFVSKGFIQRSIGWWRKLSEVKNQPYLRHVAILGGEVPGIPNLPSLDQYFRSTEGDLKGRIVASAPYCVRHLLDTPRPASSPAAQGGETEEDEMTEQDKLEFRTLVASILAEQKAATPPAPPVDAEKIAQEAARAAVAAITPQIEKLTTALETERTNSANSLAAQRTVEVTRRMDALVSTGRVSPGEIKEERSFLEGLPHEKVTARLDQLERRTPMNRLSTPAQIEVGAGEDAVTVDIDQRAYSLPGQATSVDPIGLSQVAQARAASKDGKPETVRANLLKFAASGGR